MGNKNRMWKSLKQILTTERTLQWPEDAVTCKQTLVFCRGAYPIIRLFQFSHVF